MIFTQAGALLMDILIGLLAGAALGLLFMLVARPVLDRWNRRAFYHSIGERPPPFMTRIKQMRPGR